MFMSYSYFLFYEMLVFFFFLAHFSTELFFFCLFVCKSLFLYLDTCPFLSVFVVTLFLPLSYLFSLCVFWTEILSSNVDELSSFFCNFFVLFKKLFPILSLYFSFKFPFYVYCFWCLVFRSWCFKCISFKMFTVYPSHLCFYSLGNGLWGTVWGRDQIPFSFYINNQLFFQLIEIKSSLCFWTYC